MSSEPIPTPPATERLLTLEEIQFAGKASRSTVYRWRTEYGLRVVRIGGALRVRESDWLNFLARHSVGGQ
jgi:hypothetical protein